MTHDRVIITCYIAKLQQYLPVTTSLNSTLGDLLVKFKSYIRLAFLIPPS